MNAIKGILFDKDGTLLDFNRTWLAPYRRAAAYLHARFGARAEADELLARGGFIAATETWRADSPLASGSNQDIIDLWADVIGKPIGLAEQRALAEILTLDTNQHIPAVDDMPALFAELRGRGLTLGVATMDTETNARRMLVEAGIDASVDFVCGADSGHGVKPEAGMALAFCRACGLRAAEVMVVGDSPKDLNMGKNAGVALTVGVLTGAHAAADLARADCVLASIADLPGALINFNRGETNRADGYPNEHDHHR